MSTNTLHLSKHWTLCNFFLNEVRQAAHKDHGQSYFVVRKTRKRSEGRETEGEGRSWQNEQSSEGAVVLHLGLQVYITNAVIAQEVNAHKSMMDKSIYLWKHSLSEPF